MSGSLSIQLQRFYTSQVVVVYGSLSVYPTMCDGFYSHPFGSDPQISEPSPVGLASTPFGNGLSFRKHLSQRKGKPFRLEELNL